ncbi:MAG: ROK family protein [Anaerolineaceae bacterium]|nr:ROK family protein [Anaerolineaceae bacterium]
MNKYFAGIEGGGTKFKCIVANDPSSIVAEAVFPTTDPDHTLPKVVDFYRRTCFEKNISLQAAGLACFGPLNLDPQSPSYGTIKSTPKLKWRNFPIREYFQTHLEIPVYIDTDVNGAALAEGKWGGAIGISDFVYITVGTGIGGGIIHQGIPLFGMVHPEIGHMKIQPHPEDFFPGNCPYHVTCLEGLANAPAIRERWKTDPAVLPDDHLAWKFEAYYLGQAIHNLILVCAPKRVILGGGVLKRAGLLEKVRLELFEILNGYVNSPYLDDLSQYIISPALADQAGALGAIALCQRSR